MIKHVGAFEQNGTETQHKAVGRHVILGAGISFTN